MPSTGFSKTAFLLEDNPARRATAGEALRHLGIESVALSLNQNPLAQILAARPDYLLLDGGLPEMADLTLLEAIRKQPELAATKILVFSPDDSPERRTRIFDGGADECISKPCTLEELEQILGTAERFEPAFWGIRGTLPVPGGRTLKYGGNTSCVSLAIGHGRQFVFDAGTGLRMLSNRIMETTGGLFRGRLFISHPHWDHFNSLPFFQPLYRPGNHVVIHGPPQGERSLRDLIDDQMDGIFFPITVEEFEATVEYQDISEGVRRFDGVQVTAKRLQHPGHCLAYRVDHRGCSFAYVTDNELGPREPDDPAFSELVAFLQGVDVLIHDCTYFDDEYPKKVNWGHSSIGQATRLAHEAGARCFYLFHHDPDHGDEDVERKLETAERLLAELGSRTRCRIAVEGESVRVEALAK
jgi:phosphoribosyl 1,2-cyclic phosphodiesterase/ActR/RegA family two-component response regulator